MDSIRSIEIRPAAVQVEMPETILCGSVSNPFTTLLAQPSVVTDSDKQCDYEKSRSDSAQHRPSLFDVLSPSDMAMTPSSGSVAATIGQILSKGIDKVTTKADLFA